MMSVLSNGLRSTYSKRDVDARLRVLNEKEIALQTTNPATFLVIGIHVVTGKAGSKYTVGQKVTIGPNNAEIEAKVTSVNSGGGITGLWFDDTKAYSVNLETINPGTVEADENDVFDDAHDPHAPVSVKPRSYGVYPKPVNGTFAEVRVVTRYALGDYPSYGALGHATVHDQGNVI
jgi:hypothetical protein